MNIAFALYDYYPFGGLQEDCLAVAHCTQAMGHEVHLFTRTWRGETPPELSVHTLGRRGWTNTTRNDHFFRDLERSLREYRIDGLVAFNRIPGADIYFAADPCFAERTKHWPLWKKLGQRYRYYASLERRIFGSGSHPTTLVLTEAEIDGFDRHYAVDRDRFHLLPPGVSKNNQEPEQSEERGKGLRAELNTPQDAPVVLFVGSGFRIKGLDRALKAIASCKNRFPGIEFWVVGNGKQQRYKSLSKKCQAKVRFFGGREDVARFYDAADLLLHPAYSESAGKVLLEALTHGLPVITTETCGYAIHIKRSEGGRVLPEPFHQNTLNQVVQEALTNQPARSEMKLNGIHYSQKEDLYSCHTTAAGLIEKLLKPSG